MKGSDWGETYFWSWQGNLCHWRVLGIENEQSLVFLHGFGASSAHWRKNAGSFVDAGYRVYGVDLIGFGQSDQPGPSRLRKLDNLLWARQLIGFVEEIVGTSNSLKTVLVGNSLGSLVAVTAVDLRPDLFSAVVAAPLPDPAFMKSGLSFNNSFCRRLKNSFLRAFFRLLPLEIIVPLISRSFLIKIALQCAYCQSIKTDKDLQKIVESPAKRPTAARALRAMCIGMTFRSKEITAPALLNRLGARSYLTPMLLLWGRQDRLVPLLLAKKIVKEHPWINFSIIEGTGHCPHDETPQKFNKIVLDWLDLNLVSNREKV